MEEAKNRLLAQIVGDEIPASVTGIDIACFARVIRNEEQLAEQYWECVPDVMTAWQDCCYFEEIIRNSHVPRALSKRIYGGKEPKMVYESVAAHTNLVRELVDCYFAFLYGPNFEDYHHPGGYTYREMQKAIARHDLPENITGDICDNNARNEDVKRTHEENFHETLSAITTPANSTAFDENVRRLLHEMATQSSKAGRILYTADKVSAILTCLYLDKEASRVNGVHQPLMSINSRHASKNDRKEMRICEKTQGNYRRASEMWTIDHLKLRRRVRFDDSGYFTSILVMYTLMVNKTWYAWRERDYLEHDL